MEMLMINITIMSTIPLIVLVIECIVIIWFFYFDFVDGKIISYCSNIHLHISPVPQFQDVVRVKVPPLLAWIPSLFTLINESLPL